VAGDPRPHLEPVDAAAGMTDYRYRLFGGQAWQADCVVTVDASGRVVAKRAGRAEAFRPDRVLGSSEAASR
jgi:hypothetical protein